VCPQERLVIISYTTGLSFALERIGPLAAIIIIIFYLLVLYLSALPNTPENSFASIYSESLIKTACQHLLLLVGFDTLIYQKYCDTPLYLWVISPWSPSVSSLDSVSYWKNRNFGFCFVQFREYFLCSFSKTQK
jgi:hypothetical protein